MCVCVVAPLEARRTSTKVISKTVTEMSKHSRRRGLRSEQRQVTCDITHHKLNWEPVQSSPVPRCRALPHIKKEGLEQKRGCFFSAMLTSPNRYRCKTRGAYGNSYQSDMSYCSNRIAPRLCKQITTTIIK